MSPYSNLPNCAFWKSGVAAASPFSMEGIYRKKWNLPDGGKIAAAGSCFAQHIARYLRKGGYSVLDTEPPPEGLAPSRHLDFGYSMYSARFGNIYTTQQLLQLAREAFGEFVPAEPVWSKDGRYYDSQRPAIEPGGFETVEEVMEHRRFHLGRVRMMLTAMDVLVFTMGLTETWRHRATGTVYPVAPGTLAGQFDSESHEFRNFGYLDILKSLDEFDALLRRYRGNRPFKLLLTVSPVPLVATASGEHVLPATVYSKATLRAVAGDYSRAHQHVDYFPSFEIITNPAVRSVFYDSNLRTVPAAGVEAVMRVFFNQHAAGAVKSSSSQSEEPDVANELQCEEALLEAFAS